MSASVCQSCMASLENEIDFGTNEDKSKNRDYCNVCFRDGKFTNPDMPLKKMIEEVITHVKVIRQVDDFTARQLVENKIPKLQRWAKIEESIINKT